MNRKHSSLVSRFMFTAYFLLAALVSSLLLAACAGGDSGGSSSGGGGNGCSSGYCNSNGYCCPQGTVGCDGACYSSTSAAYSATLNSSCLSVRTVC